MNKKTIPKKRKKKLKKTKKTKKKNNNNNKKHLTINCGTRTCDSGLSVYTCVTGA